MPDNQPLDGPLDLIARSMHVSAIREEAREADFICSTDAIDSYGEVVEQSWDLNRYTKNPVVLWAHQSRQLPIGQARDVGVRDGSLQATIVFSKAHQLAEDVWKLVVEKTVRAVSVGFLPKNVKAEKRNGTDVYVLSNNELYEISATPIPANPDCLAKMKARALGARSAIAVQEEDMADDKKLEDKIAQREAECRTLEGALATERAKLADTEAKASALDERCKATEMALGDERTKSAGLAHQLVERDLNDLIGKKITPAEKPSLVKLATLSPELYGEQLLAIRSRPDLAIAKSLEGSVLTPAPIEERADDDNGAALEAEIQRRLKAS